MKPLSPGFNPARLRILHIVPTYVPAWRYGGPIRSVHGLCRGLARQGHDVHVFTSSLDGPGELDVPLASPVDLDGVMVRYDPPGWPRRLYRYPGLLVALREQLVHFDILHLHGVFLWSTWAASRLAGQAGLPYIVSPRGMLVPELIHRRNRLLKTLWIHLVEQRTLTRAAALHLTTRREAEDLTRLGLATAPCHVIPNGLDPPDLPQDLDPERLPPALLAAERGFILFLGRVHWKKGLDRLIKALPAIQGGVLVIAGNDEDGYRRHLDPLIAGLQLTNRVHFIGAVDERQKWGLLRQARVLALASYSENFGNVILEAMQMGCPVVVTEEVGLACTVAETSCGVVSAGDPASLAATLQHILDHPEVGKELGRRGQRAVQEHFTWDAVSTKMATLYRDILSGNITPHRT
ncbi:MAG: glycosyltransferase [Magnetococcales bacterium]|nr:glycosyltransferase [Magnetococcales bacterium]MBF0321324.1 glycosyltransferase [Magnetococcales bacterium]